jgi:hypothetical protein
LIALSNGLPLIEHHDCGAGHQRHKGSKALSMKGWLHEVPLQASFTLLSFVLSHPQVPDYRC